MTDWRFDALVVALGVAIGIACGLISGCGGGGDAYVPPIKTCEPALVKLGGESVPCTEEKQP